MRKILSEQIREAFSELYHQAPEHSQIVINRTRKEYQEDMTLVLFPLLKLTKESPTSTGDNIGKYLKNKANIISDFKVVNGFLNLKLTDQIWVKLFDETAQDYKVRRIDTKQKPVVIEYCSPNTNKPLHLGHIRNCLVGRAVANLYRATGRPVKTVQVINDRGVHICQSMLAWKRYGNGETPESSNLKGDHLVGKYYVRFSEQHKAQQQALQQEGMSEEDARTQAPIYQEAQEMLKAWERGDPEVRSLWGKLNQWVYSGFDQTLAKLGITFDKNYYESETYEKGKKLVLEGVKDKIYEQKEDGSIWIDLSEDGLDSKLLLRKDATAVYITQDIATAVIRYQDYEFDQMIYTVGNEQEYHFQVLFKVLKKAGYKWASRLHHLSYGMVVLPSGKMKSREGTVVDADDLIESMIAESKRKTQELGKADHLDDNEAETLHETLALGALNYWMLKVEAKKDMLFDPEKSIDFTGNTGPFIQYAYARIQSILRKSKQTHHDKGAVVLDEKEKNLIYMLSLYQETVFEAANAKDPSHLANYLYDLVKVFNNYYHDVPILNLKDNAIIAWRLTLIDKIAKVIQAGMSLLGCKVPARM